MNLSPTSSKFAPRLSLALGAFALALATSSVRAQAPAAGSGTVAGTVLEPQSGKYLQGADIDVAGTTLHTTTDRSGAFTLSGVPVGDQQITVGYPGFDSKTVDVTVTAGQTATIDVKMGSDVIKLDTFTVESPKEGMSAAIAMQKASYDQKIVAASDQFGDIAEGNAAEYLRYLPGVNIEYNANDARALGLRGMPTYFTSIQLDGNPLASASSANLNRRFEFEQVSLNDIATIEVIKALTPDQPATAAAGSVNFIPKSAFDREGSLFTYRAYALAQNDSLTFDKQPGYSATKVETIMPNYVLDFSKPVNKWFGFDVNASLSQLYNVYPRVVYVYGSSSFNPAFGGTPGTPYPTDYENINERKLTKREQLTSTLDFRPGPNTKISLTAGWSWYWLLFWDREMDWNVGNLAALPVSGVPVYAGTETITSQANKGKVLQTSGQREKTGTTYFLNLPINQKIGNLEINSVPYWTQSYSKYRDTQYGFLGEVDGSFPNVTTTISGVNSLSPQTTALYAPGSPVNPNNLGGMTISAIKTKPQTGYDTWSGGPLDVKYKFDTTIPLTLSAGFRYDDHVRQDLIYSSTTTPSASSYTSAQVANLIDIPASSINLSPSYGIPTQNWLSVYKALQLFPNVAAEFPQAPTTYAIWNEYTKAEYVMFDTTFWQKLQVVGGVRYEDHIIDAYNRLPTGTAGLPAAASITDSDYYPSLSLKYNFTKDLDLRLSGNKAVALPDYPSLVPASPTITDPTSSSPTGTISVFNPNLKPYKIDSYNLSLEYYFHPSGFLSLSLYHTDFSDYIVTFTEAATPALLAQYGAPTPTAAPLSQYNITSSLNIPDSKGSYNGIEFALNQQLSFLPAPFNTSSIQLNYTRLLIGGIDTNTLLNASSAANNAVLQEQAHYALYNSAVTQEANLTFSTNWKRLGVFITENYTGYNQLSTAVETVAYAGQPTNYYLAKTETAPLSLTNIRLEYSYSERLTPYLQVNNIFNRPIINTTDGNLVLRSQYGNPQYELGIRGVW